MSEEVSNACLMIPSSSSNTGCGTLPYTPSGRGGRERMKGEGEGGGRGSQRTDQTVCTYKDKLLLYVAESYNLIAGHLGLTDFRQLQTKLCVCLVHS